MCASPVHLRRVSQKRKGKRDPSLRKEERNVGKEGKSGRVLNGFSAGSFSPSPSLSGAISERVGAAHSVCDPKSTARLGVVVGRWARLPAGCVFTRVRRFGLSQCRGFFRPRCRRARAPAVLRTQLRSRGEPWAARGSAESSRSDRGPRAEPLTFRDGRHGLRKQSGGRLTPRQLHHLPEFSDPNRSALCGHCAETSLT